MKINGSDVRTGMVIDWQDKLWLVIKHEIRTPGNLRAFNQVEMKDVPTGTKSNSRFSSSETVERVQLDTRDYTYFYAEDETLHFMDTESFEQIQLPAEQLGTSRPFLQDNMNVQMETFEGKPITVRMPERVTLEIVKADPVVKGQTASSSYKPAMLENGVRVMVPPFIDTGTRIVVNTQNLEYVERAKD